MEYPAEIDMDDLTEDQDLLDVHDVMDVKSRNQKKCHCKAKRYVFRLANFIANFMNYVNVFL